MDRYLHDFFRYFVHHLQLYTKILDSEKATGSLCKFSHADHGHEFGANMANQELTKNHKEPKHFHWAQPTGFTWFYDSWISSHMVAARFSTKDGLYIRIYIYRYSSYNVSYIMFYLGGYKATLFRAQVSPCSNSLHTLAALSRADSLARKSGDLVLESYKFTTWWQVHCYHEGILSLNSSKWRIASFSVWLNKKWKLIVWCALLFFSKFREACMHMHQSIPKCTKVLCFRRLKSARDMCVVLL